jgi:hypothetical protein
MVMRITRTSKISGITRTKEIAITPAQLREVDDPQRKRLIQEILPHLSPADREFLITGVTDEEWAQMGWDEGEET